MDKTNLIGATRSLALAAALALPLAPLAIPAQAQDSGAAQKLGNAAITAKVKTKLIADERTKGFDINVDTTAEGKVTLRGTAPSVEARQAAGEIARGVEGVTSIENALIVAPPGSVAERSAPPATVSQQVERGLERTAERGSDAWITTKVKTMLLANKVVKGTAVDVDTRDGVVQLKGEVANEVSRARAIEIASGIEGVVRVDAEQLRVKG